MILRHPAIDENMSKNSPEKIQSIWKGEIKIKDGPRIICQTTINSEGGRRLLWSVLPKNYVLANSMNYLQIPEETCKMLIEEFGDLENIIQNAGRITPKRFCSIVYEKRADLMRNIELVRLESDIELDLSDSNHPNLELIEEIITELEMKKSWEEAQKRYAAN